MWQPANKAALPSSEDFKDATKAITEVEAAIDEAKLRVLTLQKDLEERRAWLAPIRKLPVEILSEIFIFLSEMEHLAPVTIMEVCHLWHAIVLSTPRAWSLIYASEKRHASYLESYVSTFLGRSRPCLLHISIPYGVNGDEDSDESEEDASIYPVLHLMAHLSRIQCLSIPSSKLAMLRQANMPNLTRLRILGTRRGEAIEPFFINRSQFPRLQSVNSIFSPLAKSLPFTSFPPLQHLAIRMDANFAWLEVGRICANTLKSLKLIFYERIQLAHTPTIVFPKMESLAIKFFSGDGRDAPWTLQMVTPALTSYEEVSIGGSARGNVHGDVKNVTTLQFNRVHELSNYVNLRVYRLVQPSGSEELARQLAQQLDQYPNMCPALQMVLFHAPDLVKGDSSESIRNRIIEKIKNARPGVEVVIKNQLGPIPGSMEESSVGIQFPACCWWTDPLSVRLRYAVL
jgi:F-box-like